DIKITHQHLSVPSVIGETRQQERFYHLDNPSTTATEISYIADTICRAQSEATLDCLHYVTDFVTAVYSREMDRHAGLDKDTRVRKSMQLERGARFLIGAIKAIKQ